MIQMTEKIFSRKIQCRHCLNYAPMAVVAEFNRVSGKVEAHPDHFENVSECYELLQCPACNDVTLQAYEWCDSYMDSEDDVTFGILYPNKEVNDIPLGLPDKINKALTAAQKVKSIDANAFGVLMRRTLEMVCIDRKAKGRNLADQLQDLAQKNEIPEKLVTVAKNIKNLGNIGAHAALGDLTKEEIPILNALSNAILEYVYTAPYLADLAEKRVDQLKKIGKINV